MEFQIELKGDVTGKSTKEVGNKVFITNLSNTSVTSGTYSGKLKITVDQKGRITDIAEIEDTKELPDISKETGVLVVKNGVISVENRENFKPVTVERTSGVSSFNGQTGDVVLESHKCEKRTPSKGDYSIDQINGINLKEKGLVEWNGSELVASKAEFVSKKTFESIIEELTERIDRVESEADRKTKEVVSAITDISLKVAELNSQIKQIKVPTKSDFKYSFDDIQGVLPVSKGGTGSTGNFKEDAPLCFAKGEVVSAPHSNGEIQKLLINSSEVLGDLQALLDRITGFDGRVTSVENAIKKIK